MIDRSDIASGGVKGGNDCTHRYVNKLKVYMQDLSLPSVNGQHRY